MDEFRTALEKWTSGLAPVAARIAVFEHVRDIPFHYPSSRDPLEVLRQNRGSCSGKHYLLAELFRLQGLQVRHVLCTHRFNEAPLPYPEELQELLRRNEISDVHDYLQLAVDGDWVDIDCTWELGLRDFGFPVIDDWDGQSPMLLSVSPEDHQVVNGDPSKAKDELLARLTPRQRSLRKQFLDALSRWVGELSAEMQR